jgi:hypothetical protein
MSNSRPFLLLWLRLELLIRSIASTTGDDQTWPVVRVELGHALRMRGGGEAGGVMELSGYSWFWSRRAATVFGTTVPPLTRRFDVEDANERRADSGRRAGSLLGPGAR